MTKRVEELIQPRKKYLSVDQVKLHYLEWGAPDQRPVMVLLHGSTDNAYVWSALASRASDYLRIVALDQRGHGESGRTFPPAYGCKDYVRDLSRFIDALQLSPAVLMGHSMGALHATKYAAFNADKVAALIHMDIEPCPPLWNKKYLRGLYETLPQIFHSVDEYIAELRRSSPYATDEMLQHLASITLKKRNRDHYELNFDRETLNQFDLYDLRNDLVRVKCPALVIRGAESRVMRREVAQAMQKAIRSSQLIEIPRSGHRVYADNPEGLESVVLEFLFRLGLAGPV